ncbi:MAG: molybdenum cofactor guanylyltransferase [Euryarchaeota archaeon]|nr:molybdenum cofactor guanylyltransferase [Euryarchaeota archaeon]
MKVSCVIAAGGKSERMGRDKKFIKLRGKYFLEHAIETAKKLSEDIVISVGSERQKKQVQKITNLKIVVDGIESKGPVAGLYEGLRECAHEYAIVLPCDTPLMQAKIFEHMLRECAGYDAVVPRKGESLEPLHAVYKVSSMLKACENALKENQLNLSGIISKLKVKYIPTEVFKKYDRNLLTFHNINTRKDLEALRKWT